MAITVKVSVDMKPVEQMLRERGLERGGRVQQYIATQLKGMFDGYVPMRSGTLKGILTSTPPPYDEIIYDGPYAARLYYNPQYNFNEAPRRGAHWDKRAWADHKDTFLRNLQFAIDGGRI